MDSHLDTHSVPDPIHEEIITPPKVGFRFHPTDEEIIGYYLKHKMNGKDSLVNHIIGEIDLCQCEPSDIPELCLISSNDKVWYFFNRPDYKYSNSKRANRMTRAGFWKITGKIRYVKAGDTGEEIGSKRSLVFYSKVHDSKPLRTNWVIHEYQSTNILAHQSHFVLCKLKHKADEIIDHSPPDEGEPIRPKDAEIENHAAQVAADAEQVRQSRICPAGMDPAGLKSQMHLKQGVSDEHSLRTNCCDNLHKGLDLHYTSDDDVDPIKLADSFLALDEYSTEKYADVSSNACRLPKPLSRSDLDTEDVGHTKLRQTVVTPSETQPFGQGMGDPYFVAVTGARAEGLSAATLDEVNHIGLAYKPTANRGVAQFASLVSMDEALEFKENCLSGQGQGPCYSPKQINCLELVREEFPKREQSLKCRNFTEDELKSSRVSRVRNLSCRYKKRKPDLNLRSSGSSDNNWEFRPHSSSVYISSSKHRPHSSSVYIVNAVVGLVLLIFIVREMQIRH
ncbi:hypothetical protein MANES_01G238300v8 [Manihot esculenta]|uniref:Uncharacterized protein n=1 Tax=Manihot esculenta TaxID=3983 RepID=A0ACB7II57_MANES|nr:hypothetical protein MANES_01G238300v8 [Manihot esculenta]